MVIYFLAILVAPGGITSSCSTRRSFFGLPGWARSGGRDIGVFPVLGHCSCGLIGLILYLYVFSYASFLYMSDTYAIGFSCFCQMQEMACPQGIPEQVISLPSITVWTIPEQQVISLPCYRHTWKIPPFARPTSVVQVNCIHWPVHICNLVLTSSSPKCNILGRLNFIFLINIWDPRS